MRSGLNVRLHSLTSCDVYAFNLFLLKWNLLLKFHGLNVLNVDVQVRPTLRIHFKAQVVVVEVWTVIPVTVILQITTIRGLLPNPTKVGSLCSIFSCFFFLYFANSMLPVCFNICSSTLNILRPPLRLSRIKFAFMISQYLN